ncbi:MAG: hypothetical protein Q8J84_07995 [Flavobacteriaceae bacterium]|nr:hypothetical protein [Flavobacteriaceae bacterium]
MKKLIIEAIECKHLPEFNYQGFYRAVEPHLILPNRTANGNDKVQSEYIEIN